MSKTSESIGNERNLRNLRNLRKAIDSVTSYIENMTFTIAFNTKHTQHRTKHKLFAKRDVELAKEFDLLNDTLYKQDLYDLALRKNRNELTSEEYVKACDELQDKSTLLRIEEIKSICKSAIARLEKSNKKLDELKEANNG